MFHLVQPMQTDFKFCKPMGFQLGCFSEVGVLEQFHICQPSINAY